MTKSADLQTNVDIPGVCAKLSHVVDDVRGLTALQAGRSWDGLGASQSRRSDGDMIHIHHDSGWDVRRSDEKKKRRCGKPWITQYEGHVSTDD